MEKEFLDLQPDVKYPKQVRISYQIGGVYPNSIRIQTSWR